MPTITLGSLTALWNRVGGTGLVIPARVTSVIGIRFPLLENTPTICMNQRRELARIAGKLLKCGRKSSASKPGICHPTMDS